MSDLSGISYPMCTAAACFHHSAILNPKDIQLLPALTEKINHKMCSVSVLPVLTTLFVRRAVVDVSCPLCHNHAETLDHLMKECSCVAPLWQIVMNGHTPDQRDDCAAWLLDTLAHGETLFKLRAVAVWWCIWRARNETVWNNKPWQLSSVVHEVYRCVGDWQNLMSGAPALGADQLFCSSPASTAYVPSTRPTRRRSARRRREAYYRPPRVHRLGGHPRPRPGLRRRAPPHLPLIPSLSIRKARKSTSSAVNPGELRRKSSADVGDLRAVTAATSPPGSSRYLLGDSTFIDFLSSSDANLARKAW
nr:protein SODIUM POTASSIUM ROOT DEFECTIVE 3-like [Ipomoea batatas]